jgi:DNA repair exonuclease SbcCD ATPase subunit
MIELLSFKFNNIRGFTTEQEIDISNRDKIIQVDGVNTNTGGSSGAGKTTILLALDYLLGISDKPSTVLQSWLTKEPMCVSGEFLIDNKPVTITRSKKHGLTIVTPDETISGNSKLTEEKLDEFIGLPRKIFKKMVHKRQKDGGFFLSLTAKESFEFLISVLGLDKYLNQMTSISTDIDSIGKEISTLDNSINTLNSLKSELEELLKSKIEPTCHVTQAHVDQLTKQRLELQTKIDSKYKEVVDRISAIKKPKQGSVDFSKGPLDKLEQELMTLEKKESDAVIKHDTLIQNLRQAKTNFSLELNRISGYKTDMERIVDEIANYKEQRDEIQLSKCHTCKQVWNGSSAQDEVGRITEQITILGKSALDLRDRIQQEHDIKVKYDRVEQVLEETKLTRPKEKSSDEWNRLKNAIYREKDERINIEYDEENKYLKAKAEYDKQTSNIAESFREEKEALDKQLSDNRIDSADVDRQLEYFHKANNTYKIEKEDLENNISGKQSEILKKTEKLTIIKTKLIVAEESKRCVKAYVLQIFQETLDSIGDIATELMSGIPNMANSTIYLEGCKENKNGVIKDEIEAIINKDGVNKVPLKALCGGEETAIELAIDLAVIDVIETRANKGANFFIADEPFNGLDSICKEKCLHIISRYNTNKKIIMIDHSSELKEQVSDTITVIKEGECSRIA